METTLALPEWQQTIEALQARVAEQAGTIAKMELIIRSYEERLLMAARRRFGASSEKYSLDIGDYRQLVLFGAVEAAADKALAEPELEDISYKRKKRAGKREEDLSKLPAERIDYELPEEARACPECGATMKDIGVDIRRELKLVPAKVVVVEHAAHTYACKNCEKTSDHTPIAKAEAPAPLISGSLASPSLVAHIAYQKYSNGMPLYRLEKGFVFDGAAVSRQNMASWVIKCALAYLIAVYLRLAAFLLKETVAHADETTHQVLREPGRAPQTKSYEWLYRTSGCSEHKIVIFDYRQTRGWEHPKEFLKGFKGFLHTDGYEGYHDLPPDITIVGCWFHAREKWENLLKIIPKDKQKGSDAERGLAYISLLFKYEREFKELSPEDRYKRRLEKSKPVAESFFAWAENLGALPKSKLGEAAGYALSQRKYLMNVFLDGRLEFSNNRAERSVKSFVMGRKAWLFSCTPDGAKASAILYSIMETAKENGLHPYQYIKFLLEKLPNSTTAELDSLLPWSETLPDCCRVPVKKEAAPDAEKKRA